MWALVLTISILIEKKTQKSDIKAKILAVKQVKQQNIEIISGM